MVQLPRWPGMHGASPAVAAVISRCVSQFHLAQADPASMAPSLPAGAVLTGFEPAIFTLTG